MSDATTPAVRPGWDLDFGSAPPVSVVRLVRVELRKMLDTKAGLWLVAIISGLTALVLLLTLLNTDREMRTFQVFSVAAAPIQSYLVPILGILLITQEWSQRTAMVTFALTPSRRRVIGAKIAAVLLLGAGAFVVTVLLTALFTLIGGAGGPWAGLAVATFAKLLLVELILSVMGLALGLVFLSSPVAIVIYLVAPSVLTVISFVWSWLNQAQPWISLNTAIRPLLLGTDVSGNDWAHLASAVSLWVLLPFVLGLIRVLRAELK